MAKKKTVLASGYLYPGMGIKPTRFIGMLPDLEGKHRPRSIQFTPAMLKKRGRLIWEELSE